MNVGDVGTIAVGFDSGHEEQDPGDLEGAGVTRPRGSGTIGGSVGDRRAPVADRGGVAYTAGVAKMNVGDVGTIAVGFDSGHEEQDPGDEEGAGVAGATRSTRKMEIGIFVRGDTLQDVITECPVLAWMVKEITEQPKAKAKMKSAPPASPQLSPANMRVFFEKAILSLPPGLVVSGQAAIEIAVQMLRPLADIVSGAEPTVLLREPLPLDAKMKLGKAGQAAAIGILDLLGADALVKRLQHQHSADDADMAVAKAVGRQKPALSDFGHLFR